MPVFRTLPPVESIETLEQALPLLHYLENRGGRLSIDTETTGLSMFNEEILLWSLATEDRRFAIDARLLHAFDPIFDNPHFEWYLANAKYDLHQLANYGVSLEGDIYDIVVMDALSDDTLPHGLKEQSFRRYGVNWGSFAELLRVSANYVDFDDKTMKSVLKYSVGEQFRFILHEVPSVAYDYASCDALLTYWIGEKLRSELSNEYLPVVVSDGFNTLLDYYDVIEKPLVKIWWEMERTGFPVDTEYLKSQDRPLRNKADNYHDRMVKLAGRGAGFDANKRDHVIDVLFGEKGFNLQTAGKTATGQPKLDDAAVKTLMGRAAGGSPPYEFLKNYVAWKEVLKLHSTYVTGLSKFIGPDNRVHSTIKQTGAKTGRLSVTNPALQTIPSRDPVVSIRRGFIALQGYLLIVNDYDQVEVRVAAGLANEENMMEPMRRGWDVHAANAANMFDDVTYDQVSGAKAKADRGIKLSTEEAHRLGRRGQAKTLGLGLMYLQGAFTLGKSLGKTTEEATEYINQFFGANPNLENFILDLQGFASQFEITHTMLGRIRRLRNINSDSSYLRASDQRCAANTPVQGSAAEVMKLAIIRVHQNEDLRSMGVQLLMTVHDELIAMVPEEHAQDAAPIIKEMMTDPFRVGPIQMEFPVPLTTGGAIVKDWGSAK